MICLRRRSASKRACALKTAKCNSEGIEPLLATLDARAAARHVTRSALIRQAALA
ncbi:ribbon-helix-helix protein, CopG family [Mobiluncus curtisii]|uniref:ribbon-helix-helix protein, CopG family n=1 Tax=Mobiluncus curtisii TaxID=2051 RepID=UPI002430B57A|nr:ribbon-helix-helix protein, CopG family [Mobiluncus curtisii]